MVPKIRRRKVKSPKKIGDDVALELAEQKVRLEKLEKKRGGRKSETKKAANVGISGVNKNDSEGGETEDLGQKESELMAKIQEMTREGKTFEEKKGVIDQLATIRENRDKRRETIQGKEETNIKPEILEHFGGDYAEIMKNGAQKSDEEVIKNEARKEKPKVFVQQHFDNRGEYSDNLEARQEMDELAKQPSSEALQEALEKNEEYINTEEEKEKENTRGILEARERLIYEQGRKINSLEAENLQLKENLEKAESFIKNAENALKEKIEELTPKDASKLDKFKKFVTNPKVKLAIGIGLIGAASVATGGGALVGAWLHLPYGLGISALGGTSNLTTALLGSGLVGRAYGDKIKNGFRENIKEILGIIKNE